MHIKENLLPKLFDKDALREPNYQLRRFEAEGRRYYYRWVDDEKGGQVAKFYPSVTSIIRENVPKGHFFENWLKEKGREVDEYVRERAAYGTLMHICIEQLLINGTIELGDPRDPNNELTQTVEQAIREEYGFLVRGLVKTWDKDLRQDLLAFAKFVIDYRVKPLAIEVCLCSDKLNTGGAIDLVAMAYVPVKAKWGKPYKQGAKKGQKKEETRLMPRRVIVDFKSGRASFWPDHVLQVHTYRKIWNENFPDLPVHRVYNWKPIDWRNEPSYSLKDQTDNPDAKKLPSIFKLADIENGKKTGIVKVISGNLDLSLGPQGHFSKLSLGEYVSYQGKGQ